jgi:outer membrane receptor protein involved in Fe transport
MRKMAPLRAHAAAFAAFASSIRSLTIAAAVAALRLGGADAWAQTADSTAVLTVHLRSTEGAVSFAQVRAGRALTLTNPEGVAVLRLRAGPQRIVVSKLGFRPDTVNLRMEAGRDTVLNLSITEQATELEAIIVTATRTGRHIEDEPVRVEILAGEEIEEKTPTRPQDLTNFVSEMSGIRIQQTAPGRGGAAIRIQGLRGQYTQVLSDGLPLAGSVSPGLILLQMPPLDLTQVEVIKGAATALYGPAVTDSTSGARREAALNPRHNVFLDVSWSDRTGLRIEVEANWIGRQALDDDPYRTVSREYANLELLVSKRVGRAMAWLSVGNLTDVRQSRYAPLLRPSRSPGEGWTVGQWGPVEGRVANAGLRVQL